MGNTHLSRDPNRSFLRLIVMDTNGISIQPEKFRYQHHLLRFSSSMVDDSRYTKQNIFPILLSIIILAFSIYQILWVIKLDFPIHDGGLFYLIIRQIELGNISLPWSIPYNGENLPFAYPPFGFYFAAALDLIFKIDPLTSLRVVPMAISLFSLFAVFLLARSIFDSTRMAVLTVFVFLFTPISLLWSTMGGGITRSFGLLFSILALWQVHRLYLTGKRGHVLPASVLCALTILSHPETAWFLFYSAAIFWWFFGRDKNGTINSMSVVLLTLVMILPWVYMIYSRYGMTIFQPFIDNGSSLLQSLVNMIFYTFTGESNFAIIKALGLIGIIACLLNRRYFLPVWFIAPFLLQTRAADQRAGIIIALLSAVAISYIIIPLLELLQNEHHRRILLVSLFTLFVIFLPVNLQFSRPIFYKQLSYAELEAIEWVGQHTPKNSRFVTVQAHLWFADHHSEWLSVLGGRKIQNLVQGYEWLPNFTGRIKIHNELVLCGEKDANCLYNWADKNDLPFQYVFLVKECIDLDSHKYNSCKPLYNSIQISPNFEKVFENSDIAIFALN